MVVLVAAAINEFWLYEDLEKPGGIEKAKKEMKKAVDLNSKIRDLIPPFYLSNFDAIMNLP